MKMLAFAGLCQLASSLKMPARAGVIVMGAPPFSASDCPILSNCPITGRPSPSTDGGGSSVEERLPASAVDRASDFFDQAETRIMESAGFTQPLAVTAIEQALDTLVRAGCEELGSLDISIGAKSSAGLLLRGQLLNARIEAQAVAAAGLRASAVSLSSDGLDVDIGSPLAARPPNLRSKTQVDFRVRLTQDDIQRSPVLFGALQEILRTLLKTGVSTAIGQNLPEGTLAVDLVAVEALSKGRLVLVADAEAQQADGQVVRLQGLRVRTRPRTSLTMLVLDTPELISTFEGFGARLEFGLPFLRAAGIPLPNAIDLRSVECDDGALTCEGAIELQPIDYEQALLQLQELAAEAAAAAARQERASAAAPSAVDVDIEDGTVDVQASSVDEPGASGGALPPSKA